MSTKHVIPESQARQILEKAIAEGRAAELLEALFEGATVTIDPVTGELVIAWLKPCGADDGATVCILPVGHPIGHKSKSGRVWI